MTLYYKFRHAYVFIPQFICLTPQDTLRNTPGVAPLLASVTPVNLEVQCDVARSKPRCPDTRFKL
jgi:hypothetical protein